MFQEPHIILRYVCWDPILAAPVTPPIPPLQGGKMFRGCRRRELHLGAPHAPYRGAGSCALVDQTYVTAMPQIETFVMETTVTCHLVGISISI